MTEGGSSFKGAGEEWPKVAIIILNWNGWRDTIECLESLYQITYPNYEVIVVDNGSEDESIEKIRAYCEGTIEVKSKFFKYDSINKPIKILEHMRGKARTEGGKKEEIDDMTSIQKLIILINEKNYGFAEGNNIGIKHALKLWAPKYYLLLNNDTIVDKNFLTGLVKCAETDEFIGIVGPKVYYYDFENREDVLHSVGARINIIKGDARPIGAREIDLGQYNSRREADYLEGACILIRGDLLKYVGYFNIDYFLYWEETDLCFRAKKSNYKVIYEPTSKIWHKISKKSLSKSRVYYQTRNLFLFVQNNSNDVEKALFLLYFIFYRFWFVLIILIFYYRNIDLITAYFRGNVDGIKFIEVKY